MAKMTKKTTKGAKTTSRTVKARSASAAKPSSSSAKSRSASRKSASTASRSSATARSSARSAASSDNRKVNGASKSASAAKPVPVGSAGPAMPAPLRPATNAPPVPNPSGKNQAGLKPKELEVFRNLLLAKRRELLGDVHAMEEEALRSTTGSNLSNLPIHMADMGSDNYEQEFTLGLVAKDRQLLREIDIALAKIRDGTYGICEGTGKPISKARLEAKPWARYSIEYTRQMESGMVRR